MNIKLTIFISFFLTIFLFGEPTSEDNLRLKKALENHPESDTNKNGILTLSEIKAYIAKNRQVSKNGEGTKLRNESKTVSGKDIEKGQVIEGYYGLYMGHSFFIPAARQLLKIILDTRIVNHTGCSVMAGGQGGSPKMLWEKKETQAAGKKHLDTGKVNLMVMTYYSSKDSSIEHYSKWFDYAIAKNPKMTFMLTIPWEKELYKVTGTELQEKEEVAENLYRLLVQALRKKYPKNKVLFCPYGLGVYELVRRLNEKKLPGVKYILDPNAGTRNVSQQKNEQLVNDNLGHGGKLITHLNALIWLQTIYGYNVSTLMKQRVKGLPEVDLNEIAATVYKKIEPFNAVYLKK
ncbi:MAG: hypothetical protein NE330_05525 [Lentisphaeraceae bacterium]|nr:hypothetical protein [Lentisphaeraceae bacterium]